MTCAVCHDRKGGVIKGTNQICKDYVVLNGIHGSTGNKYNHEYAQGRRRGDDSVKWSKNNPRGLWNNPGGKGKYGSVPRPNK